MNENLFSLLFQRNYLKLSKRKWRLTSVHLYVTQSDFTREEARLLMVGDIFLIWDGLGVGGGRGGQLPKKLLHKEKASKNIMQSDSRKRKQGAN